MVISILLNGVLLYALFQVRNIAVTEIDSVVDVVEGVKDQRITFEYSIGQVVEVPISKQIEVPIVMVMDVPINKEIEREVPIDTYVTVSVKLVARARVSYSSSGKENKN